MPMWWNGIHYRLKICRPFGIEGSSPSIGTICRGSSEEERSPDKREVGMSQFPLGTTGEGASAFDLFKKAPSFKENVSGYNRQISFLYGSVA